MTLILPLTPSTGEEILPTDPTIPAATGGAPSVGVQVAWPSTADDPYPAWHDLGEGLTVPPLKHLSTSRGRQYELDDVPGGTGAIDVDNSDKRFTPSNTAGYFYPNVNVDKQVRIQVTPPSPYNAEYSVHRGFITSITDDVRGGFEHATASLSTTDNSDGLNLIQLRSDLATEISRLSPWGYYPLGEQDGAEQVTDVSGNARPPLPLRSYISPSGVNIAGTFKFGGSALSVSDPSTSLTLTPTLVATSADSGYYLKVPVTGNGKATLAYTQGFSVGVVFQTSAALTSGSILLDCVTKTRLELMQVLINGYDHTLDATIFPNATDDGASCSSPNAVNDGKPHLLVVTVKGKTFKMYLDGVLAGTASTKVSGNGTVVDGGLYVGVGYGQTSTGFPYMGQLGHLFAVERALSSAEVAGIGQADLGFPGETADKRIGRYLSYATWPAGTDFETGDTVLGAQPIGGKSVLQAIKDAAASEQGLFFIGPDGTARFQRRKHRMNAASRVTFNDALPVDRTGLTFTLDRSYIRNDITGTRPGGTTQRVYDATSISQHRRRTDTLDLAVGSDGELLSAIQWRLARYSQANVRIGTVTLDPYTTPALWPWALGLEVGDRVTLGNLPATAPATTMDFYVESVAHDADRSSWRTTLSLSPADNWLFWQLGVAGYSELGVSTRLGY